MKKALPRPRLKWCPQWEGPIRAWAIKFINKNKWRCDSINDFDDLLQDAYLIFIKISDTYPRVIEQPHFMSLFKRAMHNQMHDRARYMQLKHVLHQETASDVSEFYDEGEETHYGYVSALLEEAPEELREALELLVKNPEKLRETDLSLPRENLNGKLRRILGFGSKFDFVGMLRGLLQE